MSFDIGKLIHNRLIGKHIQDFPVSCSALGANLVATNPTNKHLLLMQYILDCAIPGNSVIWSDSDGVAMSGSMPFSETGGLVAPWSDAGWFMLERGKSLVLNLSIAAPVTGHLSFVLI